MSNSGQTLKAKAKLPILFIGDICVYYAALLLMLLVRYGEINPANPIFSAHLTPFTVGLAGWLLIYYIGGMYEKIILRSKRALNQRFFVLTLLGGLLLILLLYFVPSFTVAPKTNFFIFLAIFAVANYAWRRGFNIILGLWSGVTKQRLLLIGTNDAAQEIARHITEHPHLGYELAIWHKEPHMEKEQTPEEFAQLLASNGVLSVIAPAELNHDPHALRLLYQAFLQGIEIISLSDFYERLFDRVSLADLEDAWILARLPRGARSYQALKYPLEFLLALVLLIILSPMLLLAGVAVKLTSSGPALYIQERVGQHGKAFKLYKFRSMYHDTARNPDAAANNPTWSNGSGDNRVTPVGRILRATHVDEFPQLFNILRGEMSFIGPRPERPEFTKGLEQKIPYYELRYLLKPGITGWAQINYRYGASVEDAYQKLQYEIYYLKNRSLLLDTGILAKTIKRLFVNNS